MGDVAKLRELLERVEKASGPDIRLDGDLCIAFQVVGNSVSLGDNVRWPDDGCEWDDFDLFHEPVCVDRASPFTASLDASIALVERMLPGWAYKLIREGERFVCVVNSTGSLGQVGPSAVGSSMTLPLACLKALLAALVSRAEGEGA